VASAGLTVSLSRLCRCGFVVLTANDHYAHAKSIARMFVCFSFHLILVLLLVEEVKLSLVGFFEGKSGISKTQAGGSLYG
jgi:hypothetical protein